MDKISLPIISKPASGFIILFGFLGVLLFDLLTFPSTLTTLIMFFGVALIAIFLSNPKWGLFLIIIIRPLIDQYTDNKIYFTENISFNLAAIIGIATFFLIIAFLIKNHQLFKWVALKNFWIIFITISSISIFYSIQIESSLYELIRIISIFLVYCAFFIIALGEKDNSNILNIFLFAAIVPFLVASYQLITKTGMSDDLGIANRIYGTFSHPNPFASFAVIILVIAIYLFLNKDVFYRWFYLLMTIWGFFLLIGTYSRGAWLAFLIFLSILTLIKAPRYLILIAAIALISFTLSQEIRNRVEDVYNPPADSSVRWRFMQWERMYNLFAQKPFTGYGIGTEATLHESEFGPHAGNPYTHNDFLRMAVEMGIAGFIAYSILLLSFIIKLLKLSRKKMNSFLKNYSLYVLVLLIALTTFSLTNNTFRETITQWSLWGIIGTVLAFSKKEEGFIRKKE